MKVDVIGPSRDSRQTNQGAKSMLVNPTSMQARESGRQRDSSKFQEVTSHAPTLSLAKGQVTS